MTSSFILAFDRRRSCELKPCKTLVGATKIKVWRQSGFWRATTTPSENTIAALSENYRKNHRKSMHERSKKMLEFRRENLQKSIRERLGQRSPRQMGSKCCSGALQACSWPPLAWYEVWSIHYRLNFFIQEWFFSEIGNPWNSTLHFATIKRSTPESNCKHDASRRTFNELRGRERNGR